MILDRDTGRLDHMITVRSARLRDSLKSALASDAPSNLNHDKPLVSGILRYNTTVTNS